jgi:quercetin dioxygenase-like cupin family protein
MIYLIQPNPSEPSPVTAPVVSGEVRLRELVGAEQSAQLRAFLVRFEPGGRNLLHTHSFDQVLYILEGEGIVATEREEYRVHPGDVVVVPAGTLHWHGATAETAMAHLAFGIPGTTDVGGQPYHQTE